MTGTIDVGFFSIDELSIAIVPQNVEGELVIETQLTATGLEGLAASQVLFSANLPGSIKIAGIFTLGASYSLTAGFDLTIEGAVPIALGIGFQLPNTASIKVDLANLGSSSATGFTTGVFSPILTVPAIPNLLSVSGEAFLSSRFTVILTLTGMLSNSLYQCGYYIANLAPKGIGHASVVLDMSHPRLSADIGLVAGILLSLPFMFPPQRRT